ncbi:hypothetical protein VTI28DRAFT_6279 [Corynascus sepedonium]
MRPDLLPPLIIPKRRTRPPILVATHPGHQTEQPPLPVYRPSYPSLPARAFPNPPPEQRLDDIDDIDVFDFYNPCLLPPPSVATFPSRSHTDPSHNFPPPPPYTLDPQPESASGLRRATQPLNREYRRRANHQVVPSRPHTPPTTRRDPELPPSPFSIQRSPSRLYARTEKPARKPIRLPQWDACGGGGGGPSFESSRPPSPVVAPHPQPARPPDWDATSSVYSIYTDDVRASPYPHDHRDNGEEDDSSSSRGSPASWGHDDEGGYITPYLAMRQPGENQRPSQEGGGFGYYREKEEAALRDLWGVIDGLLGPGGKRLGDYDAASIASSVSMSEMATAAGVAAADDHSDTTPRASHHRESGQSVHGDGTAWWRAVRQGLLLS